MSKFKICNFRNLLQRKYHNSIQTIGNLRNLKINSKSKLFRLGKVLCTTFSEFCECSSVNGVRYITERRLHWSERILWIIAVGVSLWMSASLIHDTWVGWRENLTNMKDVEESTISTIPFPSVSICSMAKTTKDKYDLSSKLTYTNNNQWRRLPNLSDSDHLRLDALAHVCPVLANMVTFTNKYTDESIYDTIEDMAPQLDYVIKDCRWQSKPFDCSKYFVPVFLSKGLCFSFNALNSHDFYTNEMAPSLMTIKNNPAVLKWEWDSGYKDETIDTEYPLRVSEPGPDASLQISLFAREQDHTGMCGLSGTDYRVFLSAPGERYDAINRGNRLPLVPISSNTIISMQPVLTTTSQTLRSYSPNERGCFYNSERRLAFFRTYSMLNCFGECVANYIKLQIGCVPIHMPRQKDTKICGDAYVKYYTRIIHKLKTDEFEYRKKCNCLDSCTNLEYFAEMDSVKFNMSAVNEAKGTYENDAGIKMSKLTIFFKDRELKRRKRMETSTYADFLATCGGLLGLFLGMTTLSIIEILYYLSLRCFWNVRNMNAPNSVAPTDLEIPGPSNVESDSSQPILCQKVTLSHAMQKVAVEFCDNGCFHGVQYITEKGLYWIEKFCWSIAIIVSFGVCGYLMHNIWMEWSENPVKMVPGKTAERFTIPYPSITVCPEMESWKHNFDISSALKNIKNRSDIENDRLKALVHVCPLLADRLQYTDEYVDESIYNRIEHLSMDIDKFVLSCHFFGLADCSRILFPVLTDEGLCFTLNNLNSHEIYTDAMAPGMKILKNNPNVSGWSLDSGYIYGLDWDAYPRRALPFPVSTIYFTLNTNDNNQCTDIDRTIKVILSVPGDPLQMSRDFYRVPISKITTLLISTKKTTSSEGIRRYAPDQRKCYYSSERQLKFFKTYTEYNCMAECLSNFTKMECGCVKFSMPRDRETKICGKPNIMCYRLAEKTLRISDSAANVRSKCNCMPTCDSITYTAVVSRTNVDQKAFQQVINNATYPPITIVNVQMDDTVNVVTRQDTYTWTDFLSILGGFLGLFLGMSALSVVEVIYYSTLRLFWRFRRLKSEVQLEPPIVSETVDPDAIEYLSLESV